jgi:asparagine synthase (glutamine-hydrolysing)
MCGIAGVVGGGADIRRMTSKLAHRGPDDEGFFEDTLGFRRLAIIDLATGRQPMKGCQDHWLVCNGEIYNYRELRSRLKHPFRTQSDAEVILHLYEEMGPACVRELDGMFAFAIWDARRRTLFAARDRMGKKPFVYAHRGDQFQFASEIGALEVPRRVDPAVLDSYLALGYIPAPRTIWEGVRKLPPAHTLRLDQDGLTLERYWTPRVEVVPGSLDGYAEQVFGALSRAVRKRLVADVPLGALLSGGVDSTIVVGLLSQSRTAKTFSMGFPEKAFDESAYALEAARHFRTEHHAFEMGPGALGVLPLLVDRFGEPFGDPSSLPTYLVAQEARKHVKVALSGDGGDELFAGYRRYRAIAGMGRLKRWPQALLSAGAWALKGSRSRDRERIRRMLLHSRAPLEEIYGDLVCIFPASMRRALGLSGEPQTAIADQFRPLSSDPLAAASAADLVTYLPDDLLTKVDVASMASGLEVRCPFLDPEVVELALKIPSALRKGKRVLRRAFRGLLPPRILERGKMGFGVPLASWLRGELRPLLEEALSSLAKRGILDAREVGRLAREHWAGARDHGDRLWLLLVLELWHQRWLDAPTSL